MIKNYMANENIISAVGYFDGYRSKGNFDIELKAKFMSTDLPNALQFVVGISKRINLIAFVEDQKIKLGQFTVYSLRVDSNSNCFITFKSNKDSCFPDVFDQLMVDEALITFKAKIIDDE